FSPDGEQLATLTGRDVVLRDAGTGKPVRTLLAEGKGAISFCFSRDGRRLACGMSDGRVRLWEPTSGMLVHELDGYGCAGRVVWGPGGRRLAAGEQALG